MAAPAFLSRFPSLASFAIFSPSTESAYRYWVKQFILFHGKRYPREIGPAEVEVFLNHLATIRRVSASTQSQALNAVIFLYGEVLGQPLG